MQAESTDLHRTQSEPFVPRPAVSKRTNPLNIHLISLCYVPPIPCPQEEEERALVASMYNAAMTVPQALKPQAHQRTGPICKFCGAEGHVIANCTKFQEENGREASRLALDRSLGWQAFVRKGPQVTFSSSLEPKLTTRALTVPTI